MASIIIPAHNESSVIERTLNSVIVQLGECDELIVVANGCDDNTAQLARARDSCIRVLETNIPSKTNALNLGDSAALSFPRIYMDADIRLCEGAVQAICDVLNTGSLLAVSPTVTMDFSDCTWTVKAYYDIWLSLPYCRSGLIGAGVYALSAKARARFDAFPGVINDDGYVRALFKEHERGRVENARAIVRAPSSLKWLIKIKTRSRLGNMQLAACYPELRDNWKNSYKKVFWPLIFNPYKWPSLVVYFYVTALSRVLASRRARNIANYTWERDLSSRQSPQGGG